jgi:hypothetical protein
MRRVRFGVGAVLLVAAIWIGADYWRTVGPPRAAERARQLRVGMPFDKAVTVMGSPGEVEFLTMSGDVRYWATRDFGGRRWEDGYALVSVHYDGPKGQPAVTYVDIRERATDLALLDLWLARLALLGVAAFGLCLIIGALRPAAVDEPISAAA